MSLTVPSASSTEFRIQMRERALDAAQLILAEEGWERVRLNAVAQAAEVSRPTIYDEFGNKDGLGLALIMRETDRFLSGISVRLERHLDDPERAIKSSVAYALNHARKSDLLRVVLTTTNHDSDSFLPLLTTRSRPLLDRATDVIATWWKQTFPYAYTKKTRLTIEMLVRLVVSHVMMPGRPSREVPSRITDVAQGLLADELAKIQKYSR